MRFSTCLVDFDHAGMCFLKAGADRLQRVGGECREFLDKPRPGFGRPRQHDAVVDGGCRRRVARQADRLGDSEGLAGRDVAHHDLLAGWRRLAGAHVALQ